MNARLGSYEVDFLWREQRLVVETDGGASHNRASARERDGQRDAWLAAAGYFPLRFTWLQVTSAQARCWAPCGPSCDREPWAVEQLDPVVGRAVAAAALSAAIRARLSDPARW
ncbi:MAG: endonuclease domain-containing protein [Thermoleophilaceae bacterium]